jgi:SSS family solute:Na+ symporter
MIPKLSADNVTMTAFAVYLGVQWWAHAFIDGSGYRAQRLLSCKDENHAIAAGIWSLAVTWLVRSWPWYLAALASLVLYPQLADHESAYPRMVAELLPIGLKGLMVASFLSAFMGTMEAHYNLCASYLVNDVYKRFLVAGRPERHYVSASRWMTLAVALVAGLAALLLPSVLGAFRFKMELMAGLGLVFVLRWIWWRISAITEIAALVTSIATALTLNAVGWPTSGSDAHRSAMRLLVTVIVSAAVALASTFLTRPEEGSRLSTFYQRVRPPGFWGPVARASGGGLSSGFGADTVGQILLSIVFIFACMVGLGKALLGEPAVGLSLFGVGAVCGGIAIRWVFRGSRSRTSS